MNNNSGIIFLIAILVLIALSVIAILLFLKLKSERKEKAEVDGKNKQLKEANKLLEAHHLKFQLQPHTLNNILANLKAMSGKLSRGMESLSATLDYILYKGQNNLVSVKEEIEFITKYLQLNDLFISEIDSVRFNTQDVNTSSIPYQQACIPHLITAHFIENAFKHGDVNHPEFMRVQLTLTESTFTLYVVNRIRHQEVSRKQGIGLTNMKKRLELSNPGRFDIKSSCNQQEYHATLSISFQS